MKLDNNFHNKRTSRSFGSGSEAACFLKHTPVIRRPIVHQYVA
jgi:hypothetical protein